MQDAITSVINAADVQGKYLDDSSVEKLKSYFKTGELRVRAAATIAANAATIINNVDCGMWKFVIIQLGT